MPTFREDLHLGHAVPTVDTDDITAKAITEDKMADDSISTRCLQDGSVTEPKLADDAVSTRTIQDGAVTAEKLADGSVTVNKLADDVYELMQGVKEHGIALAQDWGDHKSLGISQKFLTDEIGEEYDGSEDTVKGHIKAIEDSIGEDDGDGTIRGRITVLEDVIGEDDVPGTVKERLLELEEDASTVDDRIDAAKEEVENNLGDEMRERENTDGNLLALINAGIRQGEGLEFDLEPTKNSANVVSSGGIYNSTPSLGTVISEYDLEVCDESHNILLGLKNGHVKTKRFDSSENASTENRGLMSSTDKTKLDGIDEGAEVNNTVTGDISVSDFELSDENSNILLRLKDGGIQTRRFNSETDCPTSSGDGGDSDLELTDSNNNILARFSEGHFETKFFNSRNASGKDLYDYQRRNPFMHKVDVTNFLKTNFETVGINTHEEPIQYNDNCVLYLPASYTKTGKSTKLIIFCKQGATTIEPSSDTILTAIPIFRYLMSLGYAILAADGVPNDWKTSLGLSERAVGNYVAVQSTIRAFEYVRDHYNIDSEKVFIWGYSQGGHYAQNVIDNSTIPIVAAAELSPVCSMRYHQWDLASTETIGGVQFTHTARLNIARMFDYPEVTTDAELSALEYDPEKVCGYDPWTRNVENPYNGFVQNSSGLWELPSGTSLNDITMKKHIRCPLKIWVAENDNMLGADVVKVFVKAVKNSGQVADIQVCSTGGHFIHTSQTAIGTFVENGETLSLYPLALDVAVWFYRFGGYDYNI